MSLKALHIVFITASIILALLFGAWSLKAYFDGGARSHLWYGVGSFVIAVALIVYGRAVLKKMKHISYL